MSASRHILGSATKFNCLTLTALPLLLYQGKKVRKHTLRLPPPEGKRKGSQGSGESFNLLVLGDSAAEGVGVANQQDALLGQLVQQLETRFADKTRQINYQLIANTGDTTADVIAHLQGNITANNCLNALDLVVVSTGVNDVTTLTKMNDWQRQIKQLTHLLQYQLNAKTIVFTAVPPMQYFPALPTPLNTWLGLRASMLNDWLSSFCEKQTSVHFLKLSLDFDPNYMAKDGFHPAAKTYTAWAHAVVANHC